MQAIYMQTRENCWNPLLRWQWHEAGSQVYRRTGSEWIEKEYDVRLSNRASLCIDNPPLIEELRLAFDVSSLK